MKIYFGHVLRGLRKSSKHSQQEIANLLCISRPTYIRLEKSLVETPLSKLLILSSFYAVDVVKLIVNDQEKNKIRDEIKIVLVHDEKVIEKEEKIAV